MKTVDFSETIAASDLKGTWSRHLIRKYVSIEGQGQFKVKFGNLGFSMGKSENSGCFVNYCSQ